MEKATYKKSISIGALLALTGFILSGPIGFFIVRFSRPQPPWVSSAVFASYYHIVQDLPYYMGFLLVGGMIMLMTAHYLQSRKEYPTTRFYLLLALIMTIIFSTLISFNYVSQILFVRNLALSYKPEYDTAIEMFSMANPLSFCWANEMFGYGILGVGTGFLSAYYRGRSNTIVVLLIVNCVMSISGVVWTIVDVTWVLAPAGLVAYFSWNLLMILMMIYIYQFPKKSDEG